MADDITIELLENDEAVAGAFPVLSQLRPHLVESEFLARVRRQQASGYRLVGLRRRGALLSVAGFRILESLFSGRFLYVDDLVTAEEARSGGLGGRLFEWLLAEASRQSCKWLRLDSGVQRQGAHAFYFAQGMRIVSFNFAIAIAPAEENSLGNLRPLTDNPTSPPAPAG